LFVPDGGRRDVSDLISMARRRYLSQNQLNYIVWNEEEDNDDDEDDEDDDDDEVVVVVAAAASTVLVVVVVVEVIPKQ